MLINRINQLGFWAAQLVLMQPNEKLRQQMYSKMVVIAGVSILSLSLR